MATRNVVPRGEFEGQIGTGEKPWKSAYIGNVSVSYDTLADMIADLELRENMIAEITGKIAVNDGKATKYLIREITVSDIDDGDIIVFLDNGRVAEKINNTEYDLNLFPGETNTEKLSNALNTITRGTIRIGDISIDETINISNDCREIIIVGGKITLNTSVAFTGTNTKNTTSAGCPIFNGCVIVGDGSKVLYDEQKNVGATFVGCVLRSVVIYNLADDYIQSLHLNGCKLYGHGNNATGKAYYDLRLIDCQVESADSYIINATGWVGGANSITSGLISGNVIEGRSVAPIQISTTSNLVICGNYFEKNTAGDIKFELSANLQVAHCFIERNFFDGNNVHIIFNNIYSRNLVNIRDNFVVSGYLVSTWAAEGYLTKNNIFTGNAQMCPTDVRTMISSHGNGATSSPTWDSASSSWLFDVQMRNINSYPEVFKIYFYGQQNSSNQYSRAYIEATVVTTYGSSNHVTVNVDRQIGDNGSTTTAFGITVKASTETGLNGYNTITFKITGFVNGYSRLKVLRPLDQETLLVGKNIKNNI